MDKKSVMKNYAFLAILLGAMVLGCIVGWLAPGVAAVIKPLGTVFINMMFCVVVPLVFASISTSVACTKSRARAGKIMGPFRNRDRPCCAVYGKAEMDISRECIC